MLIELIAKIHYCTNSRQSIQKAFPILKLTLMLEDCQIGRSSFHLKKCFQCYKICNNQQHHSYAIWRFCYLHCNILFVIFHYSPELFYQLKLPPIKYINSFSYNNAIYIVWHCKMLLCFKYSVTFWFYFDSFVGYF